MTNCKRRSYLVATLELGGIVSPMLETARKLVARGHDVRVMSDICNKDAAEATGARFVSWTRAPSRSDRSRDSELFHDWACTTPQEAVAMLIGKFLIPYLASYAEDIRVELQREPADFVVTADFLPGVQIACEAMGQPFATFCANPAIDAPEGVPPLGLGLAPAMTAEERALHAEMRRDMHHLFDGFLPELNRIRAGMGLAPLPHFVDQLSQGAAYLVAIAQAFDFPATSLPPRFRYVGPQLGEPVWAKPWTPPFPPKVGRKRALLAFGTTFQNHAGAMQRVIDATKGLPVDLVVTLGGSIHARELRPHANVSILDSAPHGPAMADSDLVITHGGHGTVAKALVAGKPLLILPLGRDQHDNAVRVTERGAGLSLPATAGVEEIRAVLQRLISEPGFTRAAETLGAAVSAEVHASSIVHILEDLCERRGRSPQSAIRLMAA